MTRAPEFEIVVPDPLFPVTFRAFSEGIYGHGVIGIGGLEATAGSGDWDVDVAAGEVQYDGQRFEHAAADTLTVNQPDADPRWDVVYFDTATESVGIKTGTPGSTPQPEGIGDGEVLIAYIEVDTDMPNLTDEDVRNWRTRPQPAANAPLDHNDVDGQTVHEGFTWLVGNTATSPHGNDEHDPNFSQEGHDHSGETLGQTEALARINALVAEIETLAADLDLDGNALTNVASLTATAASVSDQPSSDTDVARKAEVDAVASDVQSVEDSIDIDTLAVTQRSELPDPDSLEEPTLAYIEDEDRYAGLFQE
ncbi:hypothetical protein [Natronosalvus rutilus]|uniref:Uncharacterized protein n=1 Tax=Natronosalvus rutilus TaxID=2953753 RepID=A0A9E7SVL1_9EURY|nr:hypothetical protein [Natronosalvus rutilus]UTF55974.1 hypothetical protein NGM29_21005 [Natronosalvus rutilus]